MDWGKLLEHSPALAVALIVWFTQRDILKEQQSTNRKLARIEKAQSITGTPPKGIPVMRRRTKSDTDEDDAIAVPRTTTDEEL